MSERYFQHTYGNGLTLVGERMPGMRSVAMTLLVPAGVSTDPAGQVGVSAVLSDLVLRGAGPWDSRQLTDHLDGLGLQRSSSVGVYHTRLGAAAGMASRMRAALPAYAAVLASPHLPADGFEAARDLALQALAGLEDDPRQKLLVALRETYFGEPMGRNTMGVEADIRGLSREDAAAEHRRRYVGGGAILAVAGDVDEPTWRDAVGEAFAAVPRGDVVLPAATPPPATPRHVFREQASEQVHIGIAYPSVPETHDDYYVARMAVEVLSGGMSGRLFTEVREKRGLCYAVWAGYSSLREQGAVTGYAGTTAERAEQTLACVISELRRLAEGVTEAELERAKTGLKSGVVMSGESTPSRAGAIAHDWFTRGRLRSLDEIKAAIDAVTVDRVNAYLRAHPPGPFTTVIVGPRDLKVPEEG